MEETAYEAGLGDCFRIEVFTLACYSRKLFFAKSATLITLFAVNTPW